MTENDLYGILGLEKTATADEIKKAYRRLAKKHHPDVNKNDPDAEKKMKEINGAYEILSDPKKKQMFDQFGHAGTQAGYGQAGGAQGAYDFSGFGDLGDKFESFFGGDMGGGFSRSQSPGGAQAKRGRDMQVELSLKFLEAAFGVEKTVSLERYIECEQCEGKGVAKGSKMTSCKTCEGRGKVKRIQNTFFGQVSTVVTCTDCHGEGEKPEKECNQCNGSGRYRKHDSLTIKIPPGIDNGATLRLQGKGEIGVRRATAGDLYVIIRVAEHEYFERHGNDIYSSEEISIPQAVLGDEIDIETIHGEIKLNIPAGVHSGQVIKVSNKGVQKLNSAKMGDHLVKIIVEIPEKVSGDEKKLYEQLAEINGSKKKSKRKDKKKGWF